MVCNYDCPNPSLIRSEMVQSIRLDARQNEEEGESVKQPYGRAYQEGM